MLLDDIAVISRDLYEIPSKPGLKRSSANERKKLANNSYSDHMVYLRVFQVSWYNLFFKSSFRD